jgi:hypothetical protein
VKILSRIHPFRINSADSKKGNVLDGRCMVQNLTDPKKYGAMNRNKVIFFGEF